jgi:hypothetical protein
MEFKFVKEIKEVNRMSKFNDGILAKAKQVKSVEELLVLAKESGTELTEEQAVVYFARLNPQYGELADEELDNVAGGGCYNAFGDLMVEGYYCCNFWQCKDCHTSERIELGLVTDKNCKSYHESKKCCFCSFFSDLTCTNPSNRRQ